MKKILISTLLFITTISSSFALERIGRLGVGYSNQLKNDLPGLSFKLQRSRSFALSGLFNIDTSSSGGWGAGLKLHKVIFDEPQLNFYASALGAILNDKKNTGTDDTGFQFDFTLGSEFSFAGLNSVGFSFEFGVSLNKVDDFAVQTVGNSFIVSAVHFYL